MEICDQGLVAAVAWALENLAVDAEHGIRSLAGDAVQERFPNVVMQQLTNGLNGNTSSDSVHLIKSLHFQ